MTRLRPKPAAALLAALFAGPLQAAPPAPAAPASALTLREAFRRALDANLSLERARHELPFAEAQRRAALAALFPKVAATANAALNSTEVSFGDPPDTSLVLPRQDWDYSIKAVQPLFAGLREKRAYDQAKLAVANAREEGRGAGEEAFRRVAAAYATAAAAKALYAVEEGNVALVDQRRKQAQDLFDAGESTRVDLLRAEADRKAAEERLVNARQLLEEALGVLRVELALDGPVDVADDAGELPSLPSEADLVALALDRPSAKQAALALQTATLEVKKQKGAHLPVVFAEAGWIQQKRAFPVDKYGYGALRFGLDIFRGGEIDARVAAATERETQARLALDEVRRRAAEEVRVALLGVEAARARVKLAEERLAAAQAEYDQANEQYRSQLLTSLDLQSAEASLRDARRGRVAARLGLFLSEVGAWYAAGNLVPAALKELPR